MEDLIAARDGGAIRVELCGALGCGGVTPSAGLIVGAVRERGEMKVHVLIRPREGNFHYSTRELAVMEADIAAAKAAGADGVAIGALTEDGCVDVTAMKRLLKHCEGMSVTFHRAFDDCVDQFAALDTLIELGVDRVLTSGGQLSAPKGAERLAELVRHAAGRIVIMPGAGINGANIAELEAQTGAEEFHGTAAGAAFPQADASPLFGECRPRTDADVVRAMVG